MFLWFTLLAGLAVPLAALFSKLFPHFLDDCVYILRSVGFGIRLTKYKRTRPFYSIVDRFLDASAKHPGKPFLLFEGREYSYGDVDRQSNKVGRALQAAAGLQEGATVALFLANEPSLVWTWLGLAKLGCTVALLNFNIRSKSLLHCFSCCGAKVIITSAELQDAVAEVMPTLQEQGITVYLLSDARPAPGIKPLAGAISQASDEPLSRDLRANIHIRSTALYIYTSGTTGGASRRGYYLLFLPFLMAGLPKAAVVTHERVWAASFIQGVCGVTSDDIFYINLPLYHSAGFLIGMSGAIEREGQRKEPQSEDRHRQRRPNRRLVRLPQPFRGHQGPGALRRHGGKHRLHQLHVQSGSGRPGQRCPPGETGLLVGKVTKRSPFVGYAGNRQQTEKKRLHDVLKKGDLYFNTGDLLRIDHQNFVYFQDRVGDTFRRVFSLFFESSPRLFRTRFDSCGCFGCRWKGENVATSEVADILTMARCVLEANVYGVKVEGHEGRIGMAALVLKEGQDFDCLATYKQVVNYLPSYARPRFIRIQVKQSKVALRLSLSLTTIIKCPSGVWQPCLEMTGTFKMKKVRLVEEGFNPALVKDPLYFLDSEKKTYVPLTREIHGAILSREIKL
ncbi:unnamed protein product [Tetraodon nigroviridis]|uniref:Long-chain-fatty-acid--CoA ligase n=1 Tax=Tetraodon nigroviridis TaxID=99883 RepID=Q4S1D6_TETNG|nr:unnamed protein product [Tetraodon nigroviridis]